MAYCRFCGKQLKDGERFCAECGAKVNSDGFSESASSLKNSAAETVIKAKKVVKSSDYAENAVVTYKGLGEGKTWFWTLFGCMALNLVLMFTDMVEVKSLFATQKYSFFAAFDYASVYTDQARSLKLIFVIGAILIGVAMLVMVLGLLLSNRYNPKFLFASFIALIYNFILYFLSILDIDSTNDLQVRFVAYLYLIETIASIIIAVKLVKTLKRQKQRELSGKTEDPADAMP